MNLATQERIELLKLHATIIKMTDDERLALLSEILAANPSSVRVALEVNPNQLNPLGMTDEQVKWLKTHRDTFGQNFQNYVESIKAFRIEFGGSLKPAKDVIDWARIVDNH